MYYFCPMKHFTIPIFVPELACPNRCVFCNQHSISGCLRQPDPGEVHEIILQHLKTIPARNAHVEIGFFGGSFTGIEPELQEKYLAVANEFLEPDSGWSRLRSTTENLESNPSPTEETETRWSSGAETTLIRNRIHGIRLSTRPDYISPEALSLLKRHGVTTIELGAQSLDEEVLRLSGRGHTIADVETASAMILKSGFKLGLQMMTGLPGDTTEKSLQTARRIVDLGATCTRIYPTLVIKGTDLEQMWRKGEYEPQRLEEAIELSARLLEIFREGNVDVIRVGLHPSEGLLDENEMLAGPFHPSFRELVETQSWRLKLLPLIQHHPQGSDIRIPVSEEELRYAIGYGSSNRMMLEKHFSKVQFVPEASVDQKKPLIITDKRMPLPAKNMLKTIGNPVFLQTELLVYKSISGHPDIFICQGDEGLVVAPGLHSEILKPLADYAIRVINGLVDPGKTYPESARYNAVVTPDFIIHNLKITDPVIFETFPGRKHLHVNQGYTRCNLLALGNNHFITSDHGIERALRQEGKMVLFADPAHVRLKGQKNGFFPGCCGIFRDEILVAGSLNHHPQKSEILDFIEMTGLKVRELFAGELTDVGGIIVIPGNRINNQH